MKITRRALLAAAALPSHAAPVFNTGVPAATKDKPQSKLCFAHNAWWALLPSPNGPVLWKRTPEGWRRQTHLDNYLRGLPGQADILLTPAGELAAVLVEPDRLAVIRLSWRDSTFQPAAPPVQITADKGIETATIAHAANQLWIAYNARRHMWVRTADQPEKPIQISTTPAKDDDICQIVAFSGSVGVLWSDQAADAVFLRRFANNAWLPAETAARGGLTADDHISTAVARDGTLYVATKNSVDAEGQPQQVLRIRSPRGEWRNLPYAPLTPIEQPTRPIALLSGDQRTLHLLHTVAYRGVKPARSAIVHLATPAATPSLTTRPRVLIAGPSVINNVTGAKQTTGLVLASDNDGNVFEALLP